MTGMFNTCQQAQNWKTEQNALPDSILWEAKYEVSAQICAVYGLPLLMHPECNTWIVYVFA